MLSISECLQHCCHRCGFLACRLQFLRCVRFPNYVSTITTIPHSDTRSVDTGTAPTFPIAICSTYATPTVYWQHSPHDHATAPACSADITGNPVWAVAGRTTSATLLSNATFSPNANLNDGVPVWFHRLPMPYGDLTVDKREHCCGQCQADTRCVVVVHVHVWAWCWLLVGVAWQWLATHQLTGAAA